MHLFQYWKYNVLVLFAHLVPNSDQVMAFLLAWNSWWMCLYYECWYTPQIMIFVAAAVIVGDQVDEHLSVEFVLQYKSQRWGSRLGYYCSLSVQCPHRFLYLNSWALAGGTVQGHCWILEKCGLTSRTGPWRLHWFLVLTPDHCFPVGLDFIRKGEDILSNENWWCQVRSRDCELWSYIAGMGILFFPDTC